MPEMTALMVDAILDEVPRYSADPERFRQPVLQLCRLATRLFLRIVETGGPPRSREVAVVRGIARNVALQGEPLEPLLHAVRIGARVGWDETVRVSRTEPAMPAELMPALAGQVFEYIDQLSSSVAETYALQVEESARAQAFSESRLFEDLIAGRAGVDRVEARAVDRPRVALALAAGGPDRVSAQRSAEAVGSRLSMRFPRSVVGQRNGHSVWLLAREPLALVLTDCAGDQTVAFGLSTATDQVPLGRAVDEAVVAATLGLEMAPEGSGRARQFAQVYPYAALRSDPVALARSHAALLGPLQAHPALMDTLRHYFANNRSVSRTAAQVHRHRQSVIYRLRRITELLDVDLDDAEVMFRLEAAVRTLAPV